MNNGIMAGIKLGVGIGIGIMAVKEAKKAYDKYMFEQKIKDLWSDIKEAWNEVRDETVEKTD